MKSFKQESRQETHLHFFLFKFCLYLLMTCFFSSPSTKNLETGTTKALGSRQRGHVLLADCRSSSSSSGLGAKSRDLHFLRHGRQNACEQFSMGEQTSGQLSLGGAALLR